MLSSEQDKRRLTVKELADQLSKLISDGHGDRAVCLYDEGWRGITGISPPDDGDYFYPTLQRTTDELDVRFDW